VINLIDTPPAVWPAQLADGLITLHIIDEMLDVDLHGWTPVRDRGMRFVSIHHPHIPRPRNPIRATDHTGCFCMAHTVMDHTVIRGLSTTHTALVVRRRAKVRKPPPSVLSLVP
jgi:hypothetical protein